MTGDAADPWVPNLTFVTPTLAVGGSVPADRLGHLADALQIRAVVDLRAEDRDEAAILARHGLAFLHLPTPDHHAVTLAMLDAGVAFVGDHLDRNERVLVHCEHGIGRSALLVLCVLAARGLDPLDALALAKDHRPLVSPSPAQYEAWVAWLGTRVPGCRIPDFDAFKAIAYRHLAAPA